MKVKATPTFFLYRNGEQQHSFSGIKNDALKKAILERLKPDEAGRDWCVVPVSAFLLRLVRCTRVCFFPWCIPEA